mmetsp:Transcript_9063/g.21066  ORF Transcript_9063/g.21066 Transcript_9063/m.21066 type:complete len:81 (+) Transcript_9063:120-362(+)
MPTMLLALSATSETSQRDIRGVRLRLGSKSGSKSTCRRSESCCGLKWQLIDARLKDERGYIIRELPCQQRMPLIKAETPN